MLFVAFYILLNLVRQSALYFPGKFLFAFSLHLFLFASFGYRGKQSLRHTSILRWNHVCCIFDFTFLCPSMRLVEPILSFPILISFCFLSFFLFPFFSSPLLSSSSSLPLGGGRSCGEEDAEERSGGVSDIDARPYVRRYCSVWVCCAVTVTVKDTLLSWSSFSD
jgi:hypothetical protein